ncbi:UNVERIFIED_CONTAM: hypothetical protein H355_011986 [Colinus virginianus]|nr:hypothetical protein H355_011986 [Colinus virginianus]
MPNCSEMIEDDAKSAEFIRFKVAVAQSAFKMESRNISSRADELDIKKRYLMDKEKEEQEEEDSFDLAVVFYRQLWIRMLLQGVMLVLKPQESNGTANKMNGALDHSDQPDPDAIKMFVGQIPRSWSEKELKELFEPYGAVYQINVLRDRSQNPPQSKGGNDFQDTEGEKE